MVDGTPSPGNALPQGRARAWAREARQFIESTKTSAAADITTRELETRRLLVAALGVVAEVETLRQLAAGLKYSKWCDGLESRLLYSHLTHAEDALAGIGNYKDPECDPSELRQRIAAAAMHCLDALESLE